VCSSDLISGLFIPNDIGVFTQGVECELLKQGIMNYEW
jgi:hypothetical protein